LHSFFISKDEPGWGLSWILLIRPCQSCGFSGRYPFLLLFLLTLRSVSVSVSVHCRPSRPCSQS
jgi:hypothetical protein